jgi:hypothetical protein
MAKRKRRRVRPTERRIELTAAEVAEFLRSVRDDIEFLRSINFRRPSRTEVRVASGILRRLLADEMLEGARQLTGREAPIKITATDLAAMLAEIPSRYIHYAYAGGADTEGPQHTGYVLLVVPKEEVEVDGQDAVLSRINKKFAPGQEREFTLSEFCESPSVVSGSAAVSRLGVVRYVANKLGGVHWDNSRGAWSDPVGGRHRLLDEGHLIVGRLSGALYEVLSIAEAVARSPDIIALSEKIRTVAPEEERAPNILSFREGRIGRYADMTFNPADQAGQDASSSG